MEDLASKYFEWLYGMFNVTDDYRDLFIHLHSKPFRYTHPMDSNRNIDGIHLRNRFASSHRINVDEFKEYYNGIDFGIFKDYCSVLEMMAALAIRCEESIMDDPAYGDRTDRWFWIMINNLELDAMENDLYNKEYVEYIIENMLDRNYDYHGAGGLFYVNNPREDMKNVEIWYQLCWYLNEFLES